MSDTTDDILFVSSNGSQHDLLSSNKNKAFDERITIKDTPPARVLNLENTSVNIFSNQEDTSDNVLLISENSSVNVFPIQENKPINVLPNQENTSVNVLLNLENSSVNVFPIQENTPINVLSNQENTSDNVLLNPENSPVIVVPIHEDTSVNVLSNQENTSLNVLLNPENSPVNVVPIQEDTSDNVLINQKNTPEELNTVRNSPNECLVSNQEKSSEEFNVIPGSPQYNEVASNEDNTFTESLVIPKNPPVTVLVNNSALTECKVHLEILDVKKLSSIQDGVNSDERNAIPESPQNSVISLIQEKVSVSCEIHSDSILNHHFNDKNRDLEIATVQLSTDDIRDTTSNLIEPFNRVDTATKLTSDTDIELNDKSDTLTKSYSEHKIDGFSMVAHNFDLATTAERSWRSLEVDDSNVNIDVNVNDDDDDDDDSRTRNEVTRSRYSIHGTVWSPNVNNRSVIPSYVLTGEVKEIGQFYTQ